MRNSRWSTDPRKKDGRIVGIKPDNDGDNLILKLLGTYPNITNGDLASLTGRSYKAVATRTNALKRKPCEFIKVPDAQREYARMYQWCPQALQLTPKGVARLAEIGFEATCPKPSRPFIHKVTQSQTDASFEIGAKLHGLELHRMPAAPMSVEFTFKGDTEKQKLHADGGPIGLGYGDDHWRFVVFETDCATEPLTSSDRHRQAIEKKLAAYTAVLRNRLYEGTWGIPNLFVLFTTTSTIRLNNIRELAKDITGEQFRFFRFLLFPTILQGIAQPPAGWAVTLSGFVAHPAKEK
jgi:hypothetical protein